MAGGKQIPYARQDRTFAALVSYHLTLSATDIPHLATQMQVCKSTVYNRLREPGTITLQELRRLVKAQGWTQEEILQMF